MTKRKNFHKIVWIALMLLPFIFMISVNTGYTDYKIFEVIDILLGGGSQTDHTIIFQFRLPRILLSLLVGAGFSLSGCILQQITENPLADPGLLGINAGAGMVVVLFMTLHGTMNHYSILATPLISLLGALITAGVIYLLSKGGSYGISPLKLVLNGVAIQTGINAFTTLLILTMDTNQYDFLMNWQSGTLHNTEWITVWMLVPWIVLGFLYLYGKSKELDVLATGNETAIALGIPVVTLKKKLLFVATALAAASVAAAGSLNFVGLISPHLSKKLVGDRHQFLLPTSAIVGALLVLISDTIGRVIIEPSEMPAGIVVSVIGAPYFIFLIIQHRKKS
jgi:iron complex transport system permease protein